MRLLVIDTALGACTVGVFDAGAPVAVRSEAMARGHSERLGGFARDVAEAAGGFDGLDRIGVTIGPGSFTGLRVGLAFALGLGAALNRPVVGIPTLMALTWSVPPGGRGPVAAVIDGRRGEVYLQLFRDGEPTDPPEVLSLDEARRRLSRHPAPWHGVGSGAALLADDGLTPTGVIDPAPSALAALAARLDPGDHPPRPLYLRAPDATPPTRLPGQARATTPPARR